MLYTMKNYTIIDHQINCEHESQLFLQHYVESSFHYDMWLVGWLSFTSHQQRGHLDTAPQFTVPYEGHEARFYTVPNGN